MDEPDGGAHPAWVASLTAKPCDVAAAFRATGSPNMSCHFCKTEGSMQVLANPDDKEQAVYCVMTPARGIDEERLDAYRTVFTLLCSACGSHHNLDGFFVGLHALQRAKEGNDERT